MTRLGNNTHLEMPENSQLASGVWSLDTELWSHGGAGEAEPAWLEESPEARNKKGRSMFGTNTKAYYMRVSLGYK